MFLRIHSLTLRNTYSVYQHQIIILCSEETYCYLATLLSLNMLVNIKSYYRSIFARKKVILRMKEHEENSIFSSDYIYWVKDVKKGGRDEARVLRREPISSVCHPPSCQRCLQVRCCCCCLSCCSSFAPNSMCPHFFCHYLS